MVSKKHPFIQYLIWASLPNKWVFWCYLVLSQSKNYDNMSDSSKMGENLVHFISYNWFKGNGISLLDTFTSFSHKYTRTNLNIN